MYLSNHVIFCNISTPLLIGYRIGDLPLFRTGVPYTLVLLELLAYKSLN